MHFVGLDHFFTPEPILCQDIFSVLAPRVGAVLLNGGRADVVPYTV
jgi:hypothetical protein